MVSCADQVSRLKTGAESLSPFSRPNTEHPESMDLSNMRISADPAPHKPAPLEKIIQILAQMRADGNLLTAEEWEEYREADNSERWDNPCGSHPHVNQIRRGGFVSY